MTLPSSSPPSWNVETTGTKPDSDKIIELHVVADHAGAFGDGRDDRDDRVVFEWLPRSKARKVRFASDSPLEGNGFENSVPRCLATAISMGAFIRRPRPTTARMIPPRRRSIGLNSTDTSKPLLISRGTEISNPLPSSGESCNRGKTLPADWDGVWQLTDRSLTAPRGQRGTPPDLAFAASDL